MSRTIPTITHRREGRCRCRPVGTYLLVVFIVGVLAGIAGWRMLNSVESIRLRRHLRETGAIFDCDQSGAVVSVELGYTPWRDAPPGYVERGGYKIGYLKIGDGVVTDATLAVLGQLSGLWKVSLTGSDVTDAAIPRLAGLRGLTHLDLADTKVTDKAIEQLIGLEGLRYLSVRGTAITSSGLNHVSGLARLEYLDVGATPIDNSALDSIRGCPALKYLRLDATSITDAGLQRLADHRGLAYLDLRGTAATNNGVRQLRARLPEVIIEHDDSINSRNIALVEGLQERRTIVCNGWYTTDTVLARVGRLPMLKDLNCMDARITDDGLRSLHGHRGLENLDLLFTGITDRGLEQLADCSALRNIDVRFTRVTRLGVAKLQRALPLCRISGP